MKTALISVSDKSNLDILLPALKKLNVKIISTGGTAKKIKELGYKVTEVSEYTGFPESPGGLVKTLHPKIHAGILLNPEKEDERKYLEEHGIKPIDLVVCNLYPFEETLKKGATYEELVEMIDIGGPTLLRSAAKGCLRTGKPLPVCDPDDYEKIVAEARKGYFDSNTILTLVEKAFRHTRDYDTSITKYLDTLV